MPHHFCCRDVWAGLKANPNDKWVVAAFVAGYILNLYWYDSRIAACWHANAVERILLTDRKLIALASPGSGRLQRLLSAR